MLKQVHLGRHEPMLENFGPGKILKRLENGPFQRQNCLINGSKKHFIKSDVTPFGMLKQLFLANFKPKALRFSPWKIPTCLERVVFGPKMGRKGVENPFFQKSSRITWDAQTNGFRPLAAQFKPV